MSIVLIIGLLLRTIPKTKAAAAATMAMMDTARRRFVAKCEDLGDASSPDGGLGRALLRAGGREGGRRPPGPGPAAAVVPVRLQVRVRDAALASVLAVVVLPIWGRRRAGVALGR